MSLPVCGAFFPPKLHKLFELPQFSAPKLMMAWADVKSFEQLPHVPREVIILASGSGPFLLKVTGRWASYPGVPMILCRDEPFGRISRRDLICRQSEERRCFEALGFEVTKVSHADRGGATNALWQVFSRNVDAERALTCPLALPRTLRHLINSAWRGRQEEIDTPPPLQGAVERIPIVVEGLLRPEGLLDVHRPSLPITCPSVFVPGKWIRRVLSPRELLRAYDIPASYDTRVEERARSCKGILPCGIANGVTPLVLTAILRNLWGSGGGASPTGVASGDRGNVAGAVREEVSRDETDHEEGGGPAGVKLSRKGRKEERLNNWGGLDPNPVDQEEHATDKAIAVAEPSNAVLRRIREEHDLAKAVKADDAEVPVHLWDDCICQGPTGISRPSAGWVYGAPNNTHRSSLAMLRNLMMRVYRRRLLKDCLTFLRDTHGDKWTTKQRSKNRRLLADLEAMQEILWRATRNDWFEYPSGSRLIFSRFPQKYRNLARDGVPIFFVGPAPSSMRPQRHMEEDERKTLAEKLKKVIDKRYIIVPPEKLKSLIMYFGVPKGVVDGVPQDWRIVYHAGANGLNDAIWVPSFWLPGTNSLLRIVNCETYMEDRDIGEMFLNYQLHHSIRKFAGVDVGPLGLAEESQWYYWAKNFMGAKPSPFNSVRTQLIAEEIIRGDRHDTTNAFQWKAVKLNLPGTKAYKPNQAWIIRVREDGTLASDFVTFVDDQRVCGAGPQRTKEAGHTLSTREAYLGIQDALRKLRSSGGTRYPGAWAGVVVYNDPDDGVVVLTSQEKWDRLKEICRSWLDKLEAGDTMLDHQTLQSDRGFMVYVTQAYPAMVPYLKGFHLSIEMWRGGRDAEGWKLSPGSIGQSEEEGEFEMEEDTNTLQHMSSSLKEQARALAFQGGNHKPPSGLTPSVPRFKEDLKALLALSSSDKPAYRIIRSKEVVTAIYGFGDASSGGFGSSIERPGGVGLRYGIWGKDADGDSSNFRELKNLVEAVEDEAKEGRLRGAELWLFTDNSTAESCFFRGSSKSKLLHALVIRLKKVEMETGMTLHVVHVAGTRMMAQGTDGLSRGVFLEGVMSGRDMLDFVDLAKGALERHPPLLRFIRSWAGDSNILPLTPEEWFVEGHGITGGHRDKHGMWIPDHARNGVTYLWAPPPVIADVALEECLKATHKRQDACHIFIVPRLLTPAWRRLFRKLCDFVVIVPVGHPFWPTHMHEPLFLGISLPFVQHRPWSLRGTPLLVALERDLRQVWASSEKDGRDILRKLLRTPGRVSAMPKVLARRMLRMPGEGTVSNNEDDRCRRQPVA